MTYEITQNPSFGSYEITFDGKPPVEVRDALKALKFRWNSVKRLWYGYAAEHEIISAIQGSTPEEDGATVYTDGYLGGGAVYGSKSNHNLYGSELSAAIRKDIKSAGIKGATVSVKTYSGGQNITVTLRTTPADYIPFEQFEKSYRISGGTYWIWDGERSIHESEYWAMDGAEQERSRKAAARAEYDKFTTTEQSINQYHLDKYTHLNPDARARLEKVNNIVAAYNYDNSNAMVDYFDTNFYYDINTKPVNA